MFDGLPLHPLLVHAPVVLLPLAATGLVLVLVRPALRRPLAPLVAVLCAVAAVTSVAAVWSGEVLGEALGRGEELDHHARWGGLTQLLAVGLAAAAGAFVVSDRRLPDRDGLVGALGALAAGLAIAATGAVAVTGHAGATLAWQDMVASGDDGQAPIRVPATDTTSSADPVPDDASEPDSADRPLPAVGTPGIDVVLGEWALVPSAPEAPPGTVTFRFRNLGTVPHALRIRTPGSGGDRLEWRSETVAPGEAGLLVAELAPGAYELDCPVEDAHGEHDAMGMETTLTVHEGAPPLASLPGGEPTAPPAPSAPADGPTEGRASGPAAATVDVEAFAFAPETLHVPVGTTVTWVNHDPAPHTATGEAFDTGRLATGDRATVTFDTAGTVTYLCAIHPAMRGRVVVEPG